MKRVMQLEGNMPERALLKLHRAHICVSKVEKISPTCLQFCVEEEDVERVFSLYSPSQNGVYTLRDLGRKGLTRSFERLSRRLGLWLGGILFVLGCYTANTYIFAVDFVGTTVYKREVMQTLKGYGISPFSPYKAGQEDVVCANLLALPNVEFCSVQKRGMRLQVEMKLYSFPPSKLQTGDWKATKSGKIISLTALRGTPLKKAGDTVQAGEILILGSFQTEDGGQVCVEPIGRVCIACVFECVYPIKDKEEAFALAYLQAGIGEWEEIQNVQCVEQEKGVFVRLEYQTIQRMNM